ncbi:hypothetical protein [Pseudomonas phage PPAY]|nr:hypothetical protein [Pseudomonas phage PPAY]UCW44413.1 hypothetical protein [Pseudomonas phage PPAT]
MNRQDEKDVSYLLYESLDYVKSEIEKLIGEYGEKAYLATEPDYDSTRLIVCFERPETEAEIKAREASIAQAEAYQRRQYEELKKKFGE